MGLEPCKGSWMYKHKTRIAHCVSCCPKACWTSSFSLGNTPKELEWISPLSMPWLSRICCIWACHPVVSVAYSLLSGLLSPVWEGPLGHPCDFSWNRPFLLRAGRCWASHSLVWHMTSKETPFDVEHSLTVVYFRSLETFVPQKYIPVPVTMNPQLDWCWDTWTGSKNRLAGFI